MKKLLALLLAVAVLFTLAACSGSGKDGLTPTDESSVPETETPTEAPTPADSILEDRSVEFMTFVPPEGYSSVERVISTFADGSLDEKTITFYWADESTVAYASTAGYNIGDYLDLTTLESKEISGQTAYFYNSGADHMVMIQLEDVLCALDCVPAEGSEDYSRLDQALANLQFGECEFSTDVEDGIGAIRYDLGQVGTPLKTSSVHRVDLEGNTIKKSLTLFFGQDKDNIDYRLLLRVVCNAKVEDELNESTTYEDGTLQGLPCKIRMEDEHPIEYFVQRGNDVYILKNLGYNGGWYVDRSEESYAAFDALVASVTFED